MEVLRRRHGTARATPSCAGEISIAFCNVQEAPVMRRICTWSFGAVAAMAGGLAVVVTQSPAAENNRGGLELIRGEILLDRLVDGRDDEIAGAARTLLEHWMA